MKMLIIALVVLLPVVLAGSPGASCNVNGQVYAHGQNFTIVSKCIIYKCENGGYAPCDIQCLHKDVCYPLGSNKVIDCKDSTCEVRNGTVAFFGEHEKCQHNNTCVDVGYTNTVNCVTYTCELNGTTPRIKVTNQCSDGSSCKPVGTNREVNCTHQTCEIRNGYIGFYNQRTDCMYEGTCVLENEMRPGATSCESFKCSKNPDGSMQMITVPNGCLENSLCYYLGFVRNGNNHCQKQTCQIRNGIAALYNTQLECLFQGECVPQGESRNYSTCLSQTCHLEGSNLIMKHDPIACENDNGTCSPLGTEISVGGGCVVDRCEVRDGNVNYYRIGSRCASGSKCLDVGETDLDSSNCVSYKCEMVNGSPQLNFDEIQCFDDNGGCARQGTTRLTENCNTQTCVYRGGYRWFETTTHRCKYEDNCYEIDEPLFNYDCTPHFCAIQPDNTTYFQIDILSQGCPWNGGCLLPGEKVTDDNCNERICTIDAGYVGFMDYTGVLGCLDSNNHCTEPGQILNWDANGCQQYRCTDNAWETVVEKCYDGTQCREVGYVKVGSTSCLTSTCRLNSTYIGFSADPVQCQDTDGTCRPLGYVKSTNGGCFKQTCEQRGTSIGFYNTKLECDAGSVGGSGCVAVGNKTLIGCTERTCVIEGGYYKLNPTKIECPDIDGNCKQPVTDRFSVLWSDGSTKTNCYCTVDLSKNQYKYHC